MAMRFLSAEHCAAATAAFAADEELMRAAQGVRLAIAYFVSASPEGDFVYRLVFGPGGIVMARGAPEAPDAEVSSSYATVAQMARGEIGNQTAVMLGKVRIKGAMMTLLRHQAILNRTQALSAALDLTY
jgi:putative sterol carrier protein